MTNSLQQMSARREAWLNEKPQGGGNNARFRQGDEIFFWFCASGEDGDSFIKVYRAHSFQGIGNNGQRINPTRYCTVQNGDGQECPYCAQGHSDIKERMGIWMYVKQVLHATMPPNTAPDKFPPQVPYNGKYYFNEEVNDFKFWETSAWRESPWADICKLAEMYKGLHNFAAQMTVVGDGLQRRFKVYALPNSPQFPAELYARAKQECKPVPEILKEQLAQPVAINPQAGAQPQAQPTPAQAVQAFAPFSGFNTAAASPVPAPTAAPVETVPFNPFASAAAAPAPESAPVDPPTPTTAAPQQEQPQDNNVPWENKDERKPLDSFF